MKDTRNNILTDSQRAILAKLDVRGPLTERDIGDEARADLLALKDLGYIAQHGHVFHLQRPGIDALRRAL